MSHELHFLVSTDASRTTARFVEWCRGREHFVLPTDQRGSIWYRNSETGVYAEFAVGAYRRSPSPNPDDLRWAGVSLILNYVRPSFFALEVMPVVEAFSADLGLLVDDPQSGQAAMPAEAGQLIASWENGNRAAIKVLVEHGQELFTLDRQRSVEWWSYMRQKPSLERQWAKRVYVPGVFLVAPEGKTEVLRLLSWTEGVPLILPACELVVIVHRSASGEMTSSGVIDYSEVAVRLMPYLRPVDGSDGGIRLLPPEQAEAGHAVWADLRPRSVRLDQINRLRPDQFVDVDPRRSTARTAA